MADGDRPELILYEFLPGISLGFRVEPLGLGFALIEDYQVENGQPVNPNLLEYKLPTTLDIPKLETILVETENPTGPYGAKGLGEMAQLGTSAAISNAVYDAVGVCVKSLPVTPEKILDGLREKEENGG